MRTQYVTHASLFHESGHDRVLTDPWYDAPAYLNQWHVTPTPADDSWLKKANVLLLSHGHEDHLHLPTLKRANPDALVLYPRQPDGDASGFFADVVGLANYQEVKGNRRVRLPGGTMLFAVPVGHDCIFVLEKDGHVVVNVNDALHSAPAPLIERVCAWLAKRFPRIDHMFCGFGGASYFPNCFHHPEKDDVGIARVRETLFARNFCLIAERLAPRVAVPFAADFHLRHSHLSWINATRFPRERMADLFKELFPAATDRTRVLPLEPGQWLEADGSVTGEPAAGPTPTFQEFRGISRPLDEIAGAYRELLEGHLAARPLPNRLLPLEIQIRGDGESRVLRIADSSGAVVSSPAAEASEDAAVRAVVGADSLEYLLETPWHSDVIVIGYGMEFHFADEVRPTEGDVHALGDLVTHYPKVKKNLRTHPLRTLSWARDNHQARFVIAKKLGREGSSPFRDAGLGEWLTESPEELASRLGIPPEYAGL